jgi:hypothetical protein
MPSSARLKPSAGSSAQSTLRDLVTTGPKTVSGGKNFWTGTRDKDGRKPTTTRALVLRNGKYGAMGTGEIVLLNKMSGREKLELLAGALPGCRSKFTLFRPFATEDLIEKSKKAIASPFDLERCVKVAESEFNGK